MSVPAVTYEILLLEAAVKVVQRNAKLCSAAAKCNVLVAALQKFASGGCGREPMRECQLSRATTERELMPM